MAYQRIADGFVDHSTVLTAAHVQAMDKGIQEAWDGSGPENALWMDVFGNDDDWSVQQYSTGVTTSKQGKTLRIVKGEDSHTAHHTVNLTGAPDAAHRSRSGNFEKGNSAVYDTDFVPIPKWVYEMMRDPTSTKVLKLRVRAEVEALNNIVDSAKPGLMALGLAVRRWDEASQEYKYTNRRLLCNLFSADWTDGLTWSGDIVLACGAGIDRSNNPLQYTNSDITEWAIYFVRRNRLMQGTVSLAVSLEDEATAEGKIPDYWRASVEDTITRLNANILQMEPHGTCIAFVSDCHWRNNARHSPAILKRIMDKCNVNWFFNGGDLLYSGTATKAEAVQEMQDCINAFKICRLPMLTVWGNHDSNADTKDPTSAKYDPAVVLNRKECHNLLYRSFQQVPGLHWLYNTRGEPGAWWVEDDHYRYLGVWWFYDKDSNYAQTLFDYENNRWGDGSTYSTNQFIQFDPDVENWVDEAMNTEKKVIIITHGIFFEIGNASSAKYKYHWFEQAFEQHKAKIRCVLQGHTHLTGLRWLWGSVPCVIFATDCLQNDALNRLHTNAEQLFSFACIDDNAIRLTKCGYYGVNRTITEDTASYGGDTSTEPR